jgi:hypothetical protein
MTNKHKQGKWILSRNINDTGNKPFTEYCIEDNEDNIIGFFKDKNIAQLIASAPCLLEALELISNDPDMTTFSRQIIEKALQQAKGE